MTCNRQRYNLNWRALYRLSHSLSTASAGSAAASCRGGSRRPSPGEKRMRGTFKTFWARKVTSVSKPALPNRKFGKTGVFETGPAILAGVGWSCCTSPTK
jgi:hypothetical protein